LRFIVGEEELKGIFAVCLCQELRKKEIPSEGSEDQLMRHLLSIGVRLVILVWSWLITFKSLTVKIA